MTVSDAALAAPDPSWTAAELLEQAEGCTSLSAAWLVPLAALDPEALTSDERVTLTVVLHRMTAVTEAATLRALASVPNMSCVPDPALRETQPEAAARMCPGGPKCTHYWELEQLSGLTGLPSWLMGRRRALAWRLADAWPQLMPLLAAGRISLEHLHRFYLATLGANTEATAAAVRAAVDVLEKHSYVSAESLARTTRRVVARHTEPAEARVKARDTARRETGVTFEPLSDGLATLTLIGDTHKLEAIRALLREHPAVTRREPGDDRTRGQREVDLLVSLCLMGSGYGANAGPIQPTTGGAGGAGAGTSKAAEPAVGVIITASMETLLGLSNEPGTVGDSVVSAAIIRQWAGDPVWARRAVLDANGHVSTISGKQRFPASRLRRAIQLRWPRCTFPGCNRPARESQIDHATPYTLGGQTTLEELHPLCRKHHLMKDQPGFHVRLTGDGTAVWTLPGSRTIQVPAADHRVRPGPHDGKSDDDWRVDPPEWTGLDLFSERQYEAWVAGIIAADPDNEAAA